MKKLSVLLVAMAVAVSASAGVNLKANRPIKSNMIMPKTEMVKQTVKMSNLKGQDTKLRVITQQPEGELKSYSRTGNCIYISNSSIYAGTQDSFRSDIVYGENGKVYIKNILAGCSAPYGDSWVEGTIEGNEIHVPLGQSIYWSDYYQADVVLAMGTTYVEGTNLNFNVDDHATEAVYVIDGETITLQGTYAAPTGSDFPEYEGYGLGCYWIDDDSFGGFLEWNTVLTEIEPVIPPTVITEIPDGCQIEEFTRNSACISNSWYGINITETDGKFIVALDTTNGDVYIQNPAWWHDSYDTWVKGSYDEMTGIITIPTGQYLNYQESYGYGVQLGWGRTYIYEVNNEEGGIDYYIGYEVDEHTTEIRFQINDNSIDLLGDVGDINAEFPERFSSTGMMTFWSDDLSWISIEFSNPNEPFGVYTPIEATIPANPTADDWFDCGDESGLSKFYFTLPTTDVNGNALDAEYLSYAVWINGGNDEIYQFTFPAADYTLDLDYDINEVPYWLYSNSTYFHNYYVHMFRTNAEGFDPLFVRDADNDKYGNIGIQAFYAIDGMKIPSEIAWLYDDSNAVNEVNADKIVAAVRYFNVAGQEVDKPSGVTIQITTYTDGTTSAKKVIK